jgi:hypothetical protein
MIAPAGRIDAPQGPTPDGGTPPGSPLVDPPMPDERVPLWNYYYLNTCPPPRDPTIVWGTDVECAGLQEYLRHVNRTCDVLVTPAHVLIAATARALKAHPQFNRRVLRRRIYQYRDVNIVMPFQKRGTGDLDVTLFEKPDAKGLCEIAGDAWRSARAAARGESATAEPAYMRFPRRVQALLQPLHVWLVNNVNLSLRETNKRQRAASAMVNYFGHNGAAPLRSYKPSRLPYDGISVTVTMGLIEPRPVAANGDVVVRPVAPLFIRADHRLVDAYEVGAFAETLRQLIADPAQFDAAGESRGDMGARDGFASLPLRAAGR